MATKEVTKGSGSSKQKKSNKTIAKKYDGKTYMTEKQYSNLLYGKKSPLSASKSGQASASQKSATRGSVQPQQKKAVVSKRNLTKVAAGSAKTYKIIVS